MNIFSAGLCAKAVAMKMGLPVHGEIDFSRDDIPTEICKELYEKGFPYLELTEFGKMELLNIAPKAEIVEASKPSRKRKSSD